MNRLISFLKVNALFAIPLGLMLLFGGLLAFLFWGPTSENTRVTLEDGLTPIKLIQVVDGKEQEINITDTTLAILKSALTSSERFDEKTIAEVQKVNIQDIVFPPVPEKYIQVVDKSDKESIEIYLQDVYTVFNENPVNFNVNQLVEETLNNNLATVEEQLSTNRRLYERLFEIQVPQDVLPLHRKYIRIAQIQNHFLSNLMVAENDPLKIEVDLRLAVSLLEQMNDPMRIDLEVLANKYQLNYDQEL